MAGEEEKDIKWQMFRSLTLGTLRTPSSELKKKKLKKKTLYNTVVVVVVVVVVVWSGWLQMKIFLTSHTMKKVKWFINITTLT